MSGTSSAVGHPMEVAAGGVAEGGGGGMQVLVTRRGMDEAVGRNKPCRGEVGARPVG